MPTRIPPAVATAALRTFDTMHSKKEQGPSQTSTRGANARLSGLTKTAQTATFGSAVAAKTQRLGGQTGAPQFMLPNNMKALEGSDNAFARSFLNHMASEGDYGARVQLMFSDEDKATMRQTLASDKQLYLAGFSSQGRGHTARMFEPLLAASKQGDTAVVALPPHWESDKRSESEALAKYKKAFAEKGVNLITVQSDKTIWGFYKPDGKSDNFRILEHFANLPYRDNSQTPLYGQPGETGQGFRHKDIVGQVINTIGEDKAEQIKVLQDMDPYLGKALKNAGAPSAQIVGISNHNALHDSTFGIYDVGYSGFQGKNDAFMTLASGNGHDTDVATVRYMKDINVTQKLGAALSKDFDLKPTDKAVEARSKMMNTMLDRGRRYDPTMSPKDIASGCILHHSDATAENLDRGVYIYVNEYTGGIAQHIDEMMKSDGPVGEAYRKTMFVFCGSDAFPAHKGQDKLDAMKMAQAANFDAVTAGGYGTTSEAYYLITNDAYEGTALLMPVEEQNEQEANVDQLRKQLGPRADRIMDAKNPQSLRSQLNALVADRAATNERLGDVTLEKMFEATTRTDGPKATDKPVGLLRGDMEMDDFDRFFLEINKARASVTDTKAAKHVNKVMIPALHAIVDGKTDVSFKFNLDGVEKSVSMDDLLDSLADPKKAGDLLDAKFDTQRGKAFLEKNLDALSRLVQITDPAERSLAADKFRHEEYPKFFQLGF